MAVWNGLQKFIADFSIGGILHGLSDLATYCQKIGSTGITAGIVVIDENYLEELSVSARQCAALYTQRKYSLCGAESL